MIINRELKKNQLIPMLLAILLCFPSLILAQENGDGPPKVREKGEYRKLPSAETKTARKLIEQIKEETKERTLKSDEFYRKKAPLPKRPVLKIFGHSFFTEPKTPFSPIKTMPVSENFIIGPGDEIKIIMWGRIDASYNLNVDDSGMIFIPKIGPIAIGGLTFGQIESLIKAKVGSISGVKVGVSMGNLRPIQVFVLGEVKNPGVYTVGALDTIVNTLHAAGGPTSLGTLRKVELRRQGKVFARMDLYDLFLKGDISADRRLLPADIIFVPRAGPMVGVSGDVKRPAIYELKDSTVLNTALDLAGGLKPTAYNKSLRIERALENRVEVILDISGKDLQGKKEVPLQDGDLIRVSRILPHPVNSICLYGNVLRPGMVAYKPGFRILDVLPDLNSIGVDTYLDYALIHRYRLEEMDWELIPFDLGKLFLSKDETQNILLKPMDEIYVFNKQMFENKKYATLQGQIRKPGRYALAKDMTLKDLIFKGGGLATGAYTERGELVRYDIAGGKKVKNSLFYFNVLLALQGDPAHNKKLQPMDVVNVKEIPRWRNRERNVTVSGEVCFPGTYQLLGKERLSDIIERAGGYSEEAYLRGAIFTRESVRKLQQQQLNEMIKRLEIEIASLSSLEVQALITKNDIVSHTFFVSAQKSLLAKLREKKPSGRVVISLPSFGESKKESDDLVLEDGDSLYVPKNPNTINILGAVYNPMAYAYDREHPEIAYYLAKTGGPTGNSEKSQTYVIRADGTVVSKTEEHGSFEKTALFPGDTIIVPHKGIRPAYLVP